MNNVSLRLDIIRIMTIPEHNPTEGWRPSFAATKVVPGWPSYHLCGPLESFTGLVPKGRTM